MKKHDEHNMQHAFPHVMYLYIYIETTIMSNNLGEFPSSSKKRDFLKYAYQIISH